MRVNEQIIIQIINQVRIQQVCQLSLKHLTLNGFNYNLILIFATYTIIIIL